MTSGVRLVMKRRGQSATVLCSGIVIISEYCKGSAVEYPSRLKLIGLYIENVSFIMDQMVRHLEVGSTGYENYDSSAKKCLLVSLGLFLRIYYKEACLVSSQLAFSVLPS
ncbi:hypothetical protein Adt_42880 [Abeliophyllum distichum]|uniref:Uncharacterized protein n=1 Tax=Abeliophyllum distichum TaxID=126358 RepID=A0ABD1PSW3_9LAMI